MYSFLQESINANLTFAVCSKRDSKSLDYEHVNILCFRLDEISGAASKEFGLEKAMEKMKVEWKDMYFEFIPYRDTVSAVDMDSS